MRPGYRIRLIVAVAALVLPVIALTGLAVGGLVFQLRALGPGAAQLWLWTTAGIGLFALATLAAGRVVGWIALRWTLLLFLPAAAPVVAAGVAAVYLHNHPSTPEVATDLVDPPAFEGPAAAPVGPGVKAAPRVPTLVVPLPPEAAFARAQVLAGSQPGWKITQSQPPMVLQGTAVIGRFSYRRDWVIRFRPELAGGSLVDMRIRSKPGEPDFGANAATVEAFLRRLKADAS